MVVSCVGGVWLKLGVCVLALLDLVGYCWLFTLIGLVCARFEWLGLVCWVCGWFLLG